MANTAAAPTNTPPGKPNVTPLAGDGLHYGRGFQRTATVSVRSQPAATRSGQLAADQTVRAITVNAPDGTNPRVVDRGSLSNGNNTRA